MAGFSLPELALVLVILGVLAGVAAPRFMDRQGMQLAAASGELAATLRQAQRLALVKNREVCVSVQGGALSLRLNPGAPGAACGVDLPGTDGQALRLAPPMGLSATPASFRIRADGLPQLAQPAVFTLGSGQDSLSLRLLPGTGYVL